MAKMSTLGPAAAAKQAAAAGPYIQQLLHNTDLQDSLGDLVGNSRKAYRRGKGRKARKAALDTQLQQRILAAIQAAGGVYSALNEPSAKPRRRRGRRLLLLLLGGGGVYVAVDSGARAKITGLLGGASSSS